jgi:hypothetical protein
MSGEPTHPGGAGAGGHAPSPSAPRTGEGASTALEALIRKRKQAERPDPPDATTKPPANP